CTRPRSTAVPPPRVVVVDSQTASSQVVALVAPGALFWTDHVTVTLPPVWAAAGPFTDAACKSDTGACRPSSCRVIVLWTGSDVLSPLGWYTLLVALVTM